MTSACKSSIWYTGLRRFFWHKLSRSESGLCQLRHGSRLWLEGSNIPVKLLIGYAPSRPKPIPLQAVLSLPGSIVRSEIAVETLKNGQEKRLKKYVDGHINLWAAQYIYRGLLNLGAAAESIATLDHISTRPHIRLTRPVCSFSLSFSPLFYSQYHGRFKIYAVAVGYGHWCYPGHPCNYLVSYLPSIFL